MKIKPYLTNKYIYYIINMFNSLSVSITKILTKIEKKNDGIFITPKNIRIKMIQSLKKYLINDKKYIIVEPSCCSCEFIDDIIENNIYSSITGIEKNTKIYDVLLKDYPNKNMINLINDDFINFNKQCDIFIGNPPYFVIKKDTVCDKYQKYFSGRPNIFALFLIHSLYLLNDKGLLCYVIPTSFMNSSYYNLIRKYIYDEFIIRELELNDNDDEYFTETKQKTLNIIIQKDISVKNNKELNNIFVKQFDNEYIYFDKSNKDKIENLLVDSVSLKKLKCDIKIGSIVWNQCTDYLTDDNQKTMLIYNSNIVNKKLVLKDFSNENKKQYIDINKDKIFNSDAIVVNRGRGNTDYEFEYCLLTNTNNYVVENHLIHIRAETDVLNKIIKSFEDKRTVEFIKLFCGNNGLSKGELENILPIYL